MSPGLPPRDFVRLAGLRYRERAQYRVNQDSTVPRGDSEPLNLADKTQTR